MAEPRGSIHAPFSTRGRAIGLGVSPIPAEEATMRTVRISMLALVGVLLAAPAWAQTAAPSATPATPSTSAKPPPASAKPPAASAAPVERGALIDINSASKSELDALPNIGGARAEAIVKGRPYKSKDELVRRKIIPENVYKGIKERIVARQKS
jgi:DNA uptake protein ComE-like DNA-binding protein